MNLHAESSRGMASHVLSLQSLFLSDVNEACVDESLEDMRRGAHAKALLVLCWHQTATIFFCGKGHTK